MLESQIIIHGPWPSSSAAGNCPLRSSAWKAEQLLLGSPNRERSTGARITTYHQLAPSRVVRRPGMACRYPSAWKAEQLSDAFAERQSLLAEQRTATGVEDERSGWVMAESRGGNVG